MIVRAYGKVNLSLKVVDKRSDGYHNIESIFLPIETHDIIEIKIDRNAFDDIVVCDEFTLQHARYNLCHKAINLAREKRGFNEKFNVSIHKNLFIQAGLGGGSADAAAVLLAIVNLLKINTTPEELIDLGIQVGSDVPWCLIGAPAIVKEKGNVVQKINVTKQYNCVIVQPKRGLATEKVFKIFDELPAPDDSNRASINEIANKLVKGASLQELGELIYNDLETPAISLVEEIAALKKQLKDFHFHLVSMSGAGSSVYGLTTSPDKAKRAEDFFAKQGYQVEYTKTRLFKEPKFSKKTEFCGDFIRKG